MSLRHLIIDINTLGIYPDVFLSMLPSYERTGKSIPRNKYYGDRMFFLEGNVIVFSIYDVNKPFNNGRPDTIVTKLVGNMISKSSYRDGVMVIKENMKQSHYEKYYYHDNLICYYVKYNTYEKCKDTEIYYIHGKKWKKIIYFRYFASRKEITYYDRNGNLSNHDGPAVIRLHPDGRVYKEKYYINGMKVSKDEIYRI